MELLKEQQQTNGQTHPLEQALVAYATENGHGISPCYLNVPKTSNDQTQRPASISRTASYYDMIKGDIGRVLYSLDYSFTEFEDHVVYEELMNSYWTENEVPSSKFTYTGYRFQLPLRYWCKIQDDCGMHVVNILPEMECVGYQGMDPVILEKRESLEFLATKRLNILPSMFASNKTHQWDYYPAEYLDYSNNYTAYRKLHFHTVDKYHLYVTLTDRDYWNLLRKSWLPGLVYLYKGQTLYYEEVSFPPLSQLDGYRFWSILYSDRSVSYLPYNHLTNYFLGESVRNRREQRSRRQPRVYSIKRLFEQENITLQGLTTWFSNATQNQDLTTLESLKQLGVLAKSINGYKTSCDEFLKESWVQFILKLVVDISTEIKEIMNMFATFASDPCSFVEFISKKARSPSMSNFSWYSAAKAGILATLAIHFYGKSRLISTGLAYIAFSAFFHNHFTNKNLVRTCAILSTLTFIGVMAATQQTSAPIQLQGESNLVSMIYATVTTIIVGIGGLTTPSGSELFNHISKQTKGLFQFSRGTLTLTKCIEFIINAFNKTITYFFGENFLYKALVTMSVTSEDLKAYIQYSLNTQPDNLAAKLTLDHEAREEWERMCKLHMEFIKAFSSNKPPTETHIGYSMYSKAALAFLKLKDEYDKISDSLQHFRSEPFMIWIYGQPGTGKTAIRDVFVNHLYRWHRTIDPTLPDAKRTGLLYVRNPADQYASKYNGQFAMGYDDVGQNRRPDNPEFNEIMSMGSINQVRLNMADLGEKGKMFSSKVIIMAANSANVAHNNLILKPEAFNRRRHIVLEMVRPFNDENVNLATSKADFNKLRLVVRDSLNPEIIIKSFPEDVTKFDESQTVQKQFFEWLAPKYVQHVKSQKRFIEGKQTQLDQVLNSKRAEDIVDIDEDGNIIYGEDTVDEIPSMTDDELKDYIGGLDRIEAKCLALRSQRTDFADLYKIISESDTPFAKTDLISIQYLQIAYKYGIEEPIFPYKDSTHELTTEQKSSLDELWNITFTRIKDKTNWIKFGALVATAGGILGLYKLLTKSKDEVDIQSYNLETKAPTTHKVSVQAYDLNTKAPKTNNVVVQAYDLDTKAPRTNTVTIQRQDIIRQSENIELSDFHETPPSNIDVLQQHFEKSFGRMFRAATKEETGSEMNCFNLAYNYWMVPRHFFPKEINGRYRLILRRLGFADMEFDIPHTDISQLISRDVNGKEFSKDLCLVHLKTLPHGRNHIRHFATKDDIINTRNFGGRLLRWNKALKRPETVVCGLVNRWDIPVSINNEGQLLYYSHGYSYNYETSMGDCGGLVISSDNTTNARLFGVHFGLHTLNKKGMSFNVMREELQEWIDLIVHDVDRIEPDEPTIEIQEHVIPQELMKDDETPYFEYCGFVSDGPSPALKHKHLFRSPLFDEVYPKEKDLSVLRKDDLRMDEEFRGDPDILTRGVIDYSYESKPWPQQELNMAQNCLYHEINSFTETIYREVQTQDWALNGTWIGDTRLEHTEPLNLKTSAGYGLKGTKLEHFARDERDRIYVSNPRLQTMIDEQWNAWLIGHTHPTIWAHALKSEPVKLSKITNGNTRTFCVAQTAFLVNVRRLFGSFTVAMKNSKITSFSCLGMDSFSSQWNDLYNNLRNTGPHGIDMDFFKFDRTAVTWQLAKAVCDVINRWYGDDIKYQRMRVIAFMDLINSYTLIGKHLVRKNRGNPSGNPLTTELNNCVNFLMMAMVYFLSAKKLSPQDYSIKRFFENINMKTYGDDILYAVSLSCEQWFRPEDIEATYKEFGVPVTPADKSDNGLVYKDINELTFLKCEFLPFDHPTIKWQAGLSRTSIRSMVQFYRLKPNQGTMIEAVHTNCYESLKFAYHWGQEFWEDHYSRLNRFFEENGLPLLTSSFLEHDIQYRAKLE